MKNKQQDTDTTASTGKTDENPTFDSVNVDRIDFIKSVDISVDILVKNTMPPIPNKNRDDSGNNQNES
jgi:hypothetical protein